MKRLLAVLVFVSLFFQIFIPHALAQIPSPSTSPAPISGRLNADVPQDYGTHTQMVLIEIMAAFSCQLIGVDPVNPNGKCLGVDPKTNKIGFVENGGGAISVMSTLIAGTMNIPISAGDYMQYTASNFGITKSTYAQQGGSGFTRLEPLISIWIQFRNVVYVLFVVIFMAIGFGIVFRFKVDPRTVMTIQNSIPKAIITLVLVTFSFAIAGALIDFMYLFMYFMYEMLSQVEGVKLQDINPTNLQTSTPFGAMGPFGGISGLTKNVASSFGDVIEGVAKSLIDKILGGGIIGAITGSLLGNFLNGIASVLLALIIFIALLSALFRLWIVILKSYLFILIDVVVAPIWIGGSLIPGSPLSAGTWFKHILKYLAVFPITFFMFLLGAVFVQVFNVESGQYFTPPFLGVTVNPKHIGSLIGLAIVLMTPEVINMIQDVIKAPVNKYQAAIGTAFSVGAGTVGKTVSPIKSAAWAHDKSGNAEGFVNRRIWTSLRNRERDRAKQGKGGGIPGFLANRMVGPDRQRRIEREQELKEAAGNPINNNGNAGENDEPTTPNPRPNSPIPGGDTSGATTSSTSPDDTATVQVEINNHVQVPHLSGEPKNSEILHRMNTRGEDRARAETTLRGHQTAIRDLVNRINSGENITENNPLFTNLLARLQDDPEYIKRAQSKRGVLRPEEIEKAVRRELMTDLPILLHRYDLRSVIRARNSGATS